MTVAKQQFQDLALRFEVQILVRLRIGSGFAARYQCEQKAGYPGAASIRMEVRFGQINTCQILV
jgi:hypothetical protein